MALPQYNTEQLILSIQRRCTVPTSQLTYTETDWAAMATEEMFDILVPMIMSTREEYFVGYVDVPLVEGVIEMPGYTIGEKLRSICYVQGGSPVTLINLPRIDLDIVAGLNQLSFSTIAGFYITGNTLNIYPQNALPQNSTIRLYFYKRRLNLAEPENYGQVVSVDELTGTVQLSNVPTSWEVGTELNSVSGTPNFQITNPLMTVTAVSSPTIILDNVTDVLVGDYFSDVGWSAIPQIPVEAHGYLAQLTAIKALEGLGALEGMKAAQEKLEKMTPGLMIVTSQRVDGSVKKLVNPNRINGYGWGLGRRRWGGW